MSFVSSLNETPYALTFAGQATPWRTALDEIARDPEIAEIVAGVIKASDQVLSPVRRSLATQSVASLPFELPAAPESAAVTRDVAGPDEAALSVPGIVATQLGALIDLTRAGLNIVANQPTAFEGHSQGVLGVEIARAWIAGDEARAASVFALARLIGAAAARITRRARAPHAGDATYMVSVRGVSDALLGRIIDSLPSTSHPLSIALRNDTDTHVVSGAPNDLASLVAAIERAAAKEQAPKERTAIVERAEAIAEQDPARTQWKNSGTELRELLESWKSAQRRGPRLDRPTEDGLWKRFSHARTTFDRHRRQFFSELDAKQAQVRAAKEALIKRAEEMQNSTDWAGTSAKYRDLLAEWKKAGRASRKEDDALWARFRAAQQVFYDARRAKDEAVDAEFAENLKVKEALVAKAEALLPVKDVKAAKKALRPIQDAWEEAGRVPRGAVRRIEGRMRAVEDAIREAENAEWRRTDPETKARAEGLAGQLQDAIAGLEKDLAAAQAAGDAKKIAEAEAALTARRAWLEQVLRSAKA